MSGRARTFLAITAVGGLVLKKLHFKLPETTTPVAISTTSASISSAM